ncbi:MAG: hypothetical protein FWD66_06460 [Paludibacter sp.]|nr:hypothetical protein [Paludibacter sp.]
MNKIEQLTPTTRIFTTGVAAYTFSTGNVVSNPSYFTFSEDHNFEDTPVMLYGYKMLPYGPNNDLPNFIRSIMEKNNLAPGILNREIGLLYGAGPALYRLHYIEGEIHRDYDTDKEIWNWLKSWNYKKYIQMAITEYKYMNGFFSRQYRNKGARAHISKPFIRQLEIVPSINARLEWVNRFRSVVKRMRINPAPLG